MAHRVWGFVMRYRRFVLGCLCGAVFAGPPRAAAQARVAGSVGLTSEGVPSFGHVFVIVGENTKLNQLTPKHTPYLANAGDSATFKSYRVKHNPAVYYDDVEGAGGVW